MSTLSLTDFVGISLLSVVSYVYLVFCFSMCRRLILIIVAAVMLTLAFLGFCKLLIPSIFTYRNGDFV